MLDEAHIVADLPPFLKSAVAQHSVGKLLRRVESFKYLDTFTTESVAGMATLKKVPVGHDVYRMGDVSHSLFVLCEGEVLLEEGSDHHQVRVPLYACIVL